MTKGKPMILPTVGLARLRADPRQPKSSSDFDKLGCLVNMRHQPRFVVRPVDARDISNRVRDTQWDVVDLATPCAHCHACGYASREDCTHGAFVSNHDSRAQARAAARAINLEWSQA